MKTTTCSITPQISKEESILFTELVKKFPRNVAVAIYGKMNDIEFQEFIETNNIVLNEQGEPNIDDILKSEYIRDSVGIDNKLFEVYFDIQKQLITRTSKIENNKAKNRASALLEIQELQDKMKTLSVEASIVEYTNQANELLKRSNVKFNSKYFTLNAEQLRAYVDIAQSYNTILKDIQAELKQSEKRLYRDFNLSYEDLHENLESAISLSDSILKDASTKKLELGSEFLYSFNTNVNLTVTKLKLLLKKGLSDISTASRWFSSVSNSQDDVLALLAKGVNTAKEKARIKSLQFNSQLLEKTMKYEEYMKSKGVDINNPDKLYEPIINKEKGEFVSIEGDNYIDEKNQMLQLTLNEDGVKQEYIVKEPELYTLEDKVFNNKLKNNKKLIFNFFTPERWNKDLKQLVQGDIHKYTDEFLKQRNMFETYSPIDRVWVKQSQISDELYKQYLDVYFKPPVVTTSWDGSKIEKKETRFVKEEYIEIHNENYMSTEYLDIYKDPNIAEYYDFIIENYLKQQEAFPDNYKLGYKLPRVHKNSIERFFTEGLTKDNVVKELKSQFNRKEGRDFYGMVDESDNLISMLPIYFTGKMETSDISTNVGKSISLFSTMAYDYDEMDKIIADIENINDLIGEREVLLTNGLGKKIGNYLLGKQGIEESVTKRGSETELFKQVNDYLKSFVYGISEEKEEILGFNEKQINGLMKFNFIKSLSFNVFSAASNVLNAGSQQLAESIGGSYYSKEDYGLATKQYASNYSMITDIGKRKKTNKINLLNTYFGFLNDNTGYNDPNHILKRLNTDTLMALDHAGDHFNKSRIGLAVLNGFKVKKDGVELLDSNNKPYKLFDVLEIDENFNIIKKIDFDFTESDRLSLTFKARRLNQMLHGTYTEADRVAAKRYVIGRAVLSYRNWIEPSFRKRFEFIKDSKGRIQPVYDYQLDDFRKGNYISFYQYMVNGVLPDIKKIITLSNDKKAWAELSDLDRANVKKTVVELTYMLGMYILGSFLYGLVDYDDESLANKTLAFAAYQCNRLFSETAFFVNPKETLKIIKTPSAQLSTISNVFETMGLFMPKLDKETGEWGIDANDIIKTGSNKGEYKIYRNMVKEVPILTVIERLSDINKTPQ